MNFPPRRPPSELRALLGVLGRRLAVPVALATASLWAPCATAFADTPNATLESVLAALAQHPHGHVLYTEQIDSPLLKRPLHASGELFFETPDRLEKRTLLPKPQDLIVEGDLITIVRGKHRTSLQLSDYPQLSPLLNGIRATLAGDRASLEHHFQVALAASGSAWSLTLQPLASETKPVYKDIEIRGVDGNIQGITLQRSTGERTTMSLSEPTGP